MPETKNFSSADINPAGSEEKKDGADLGAAGTSDEWKTKFEAAERERVAAVEKITEQGKELGGLRGFINDIDPILEELDKNPEIVKSIMSGGISREHAIAALEGRLVISDTVNKAHEEVKKEMGSKAYDKASAEEISSLIEKKVKEAESKIEEKFKTIEVEREFAERTRSFLEKTPDIEDFTEDISKWLDEHPEVTDLEVAYYAVKGALSTKEAQKKAEEEAAERAKDLALNATGGSSRTTNIGSENSDLIDSMIATKSNPNIF